MLGVCLPQFSQWYQIFMDGSAHHKNAFSYENSCWAFLGEGLLDCTLLFLKYIAKSQGFVSFTLGLCLFCFGFIPKVLGFFSVCLSALLQDGWIPNWIRTTIGLNNNTALTCQCMQVVSVCIFLYNDQHALCIVWKI